jgi:hypothetical protein
MRYCKDGINLAKKEQTLQALSTVEEELLRDSERIIKF